VEDRAVPTLVEPPNSVLLLVGREDFTPPASFGGGNWAATEDCLAVGTVSVDDAPTLVAVGPAPSTSGLIELADVTLESEGFLSLRSVFSHEYETVGVDPGLTRVVVWANDESEPSEVYFEVRMA
jgi:hypothetical protein